MDVASAQNYLLPAELAELADAINSYISNLTTLIKNGIGGSLSNVNAQELQAWADSLDTGLELQFTRTANGLKLST